MSPLVRIAIAIITFLIYTEALLIEAKASEPLCRVESALLPDIDKTPYEAFKILKNLDCEMIKHDLNGSHDARTIHTILFEINYESGPIHGHSILAACNESINSRMGDKIRIYQCQKLTSSTGEFYGTSKTQEVFSFSCIDENSLPILKRVLSDNESHYSYELIGATKDGRFWRLQAVNRDYICREEIKSSSSSYIRNSKSFSITKQNFLNAVSCQLTCLRF